MDLFSSSKALLEEDHSPGTLKWPRLYSVKIYATWYCQTPFISAIPPCAVDIGGLRLLDQGPYLLAEDIIDSEADIDLPRLL